MGLNWIGPGWLLVAIVSLLFSDARAVSTIPPSDRVLFAAAEIALVRLSPSGGHLAALKDGKQIIVQRRGRRGQRPIRSFEYGQVQAIYWATDERLLMSVRGPGQAAGLSAINRDGSDYRVLVAPGESSAARAGARLLDLIRSEPASVLISDDTRQPWAPDVVRLDLFSGERQLVEENSGRVIRWITDRNGNVRLASAWRAGAQGPEIEVRFREGIDQAWRSVSRSAFADGWWRPLAFAADNQSFYVGNDRNRDTVAIQRFDPRNGRLEPPLFSHARVDANAILFSDRALPAAIPFDDGLPQQHFLDPDWQALQRWVDRQLPRPHQSLHQLVVGFSLRGYPFLFRRQRGPLSAA